MKKLFFTLLSFGLLYINTNAQYCGGSGSSVCTPSGTLTQPGLSPSSDSLPVLINGQVINEVIQFKNFDTVSAIGQTFTVQSLTIDTISNLPVGLCWATSSSSNTFPHEGDGCIKISSSQPLCATPGQYRLRIIVDVNVGFNYPDYDASGANLYVYVRVKNAGDTDTPVDTTGQAAGTNTFKTYNETANCTPNGISELAQTVTSLNIVPNVFDNSAEVIFFSDKQMNMTEKITNLLGSEVYTNELEVKQGENKSAINRNNLPSGVYFYSLTDGKSLITRRFIITE